METADFIISNVQPRPGHSLRFLHMECQGTPCYIEDLEKSYRGLIMYKPEYEDRFHRLHTSIVKSIEREANDAVVIITTMNTVYTLTRTNFDETTYRGVCCLTEDEAERYVKAYISKGFGKKLMETIYKGKAIDTARAASSLFDAVKWTGEPRDRAIYRVFLDALSDKKDAQSET